MTPSEPCDERPVRSKRRFWYSLLILAMGLLWIFRPHWPADPAKVHPLVSSLKTPLKSIRWTMYLDGGTKVIAIRDAEDTQLYAVIPSPSDKDFDHSKDLFLGAPDYRAPGAHRVFAHPHTRRALRQLLADYRPRKEVSDIAIFNLSRRSSDLLVLKYRQRVPPHANYLAIPDHLEDFDVEDKPPAVQHGRVPQVDESPENR